MGGKNTGPSASRSARGRSSWSRGAHPSVTAARHLATLGIVAASLVYPVHARAVSPASTACARAAEEGQALRDEGKLFSAKASFGQCIRSECPKVIATECASWLDDVTARQPSIVIAVRDAKGNDVTDAAVLVDGVPRADASSGRAIVLDPGPHVVASTIAGRAVEQRIVLREREKSRKVALEPPQAAAPRLPPPRPLPPPLVQERPVPIVSYVLGGVSVVLGGAGAGFGISAASDYAKLEESCPTRCSDTDILGLRAKTVTADIAFSLAIAAAVGAVVVYLVRPTVVRQAGSKEAAWVELSRGLVRF